MDNKLTHEEIASVFTKYIGQPVLVEGGAFEHLKGSRSEKLLGVINDNASMFFTAANGGLRNSFYFKDANYKLLLNDFSRITDEEILNLSKIFYYKDPIKTEKFQDAIRIFYSSERGGLSLTIYDDFSMGLDGEDYAWEDPLSYSFAIEYLTDRGYPTPLFFGPGHWANGMSAVELDIANCKTKVL
jgi:hypothetical protein